MNKKCPNCGGIKVQLSNERSKNGCLWFIIFGWVYVVWVIIKWMIGFLILAIFDWWMAIIQTSMGKGYVWQSKKWFSGVKKIYFCHDCGNNFRG